MQGNISRLQRTREALAAIGASRSSIASLDPALSSLTVNDAHILDAIIARVPNATSFTTVFKAYSEVLQERGLDPSSDVLYYKQLLKLGVVKGSTWGIKWQSVKEQLGLFVDSQTKGKSPQSPVLPPNRVESPRVAQEDVFTSRAQIDEATTAVEPAFTLRRPWSAWMKADFDDSGAELLHSTPCQSRAPAQPVFTSSTPLDPPSSSVIKNNTPSEVSMPSLPNLQRVRKPYDRSAAPKLSGGFKEGQLKPANDTDAWEKIQKSKDLDDADRFRRESLYLMCFQTWRAGLEWIRSTHIQITEARDLLLLQIYFKRWKAKRNLLVCNITQASIIHKVLVYKTSFRRWRTLAARKRAEKWKDGMRRRMIQMEHRLDSRIIDEAWTRWRQLYLSRQLYSRHVLSRIFHSWLSKLKKLHTLGNMADQLEDAMAQRSIGNAFDIWARRTHMRDAERYLNSKHNHGILAVSLTTWSRNLGDIRCANAFNAQITLKYVMNKWRKVQAGKQAMQVKLQKYERRRDNLLLRAVIRVWVARERGLLIQRIKITRLAKDTLFIWGLRLKHQKDMYDKAVIYSQYISNRFTASYFAIWMQRRLYIQQQYNLAEQYYKANLSYRALLMWRLRLRIQLRLFKKAKIVRKYFQERQAWGKWRSALKIHRRNRLLLIFEKAKLHRYFIEWLQLARHRKQEQVASMIIQTRSNQLLLRQALERWIQKVVFVRLREIETIEHRGINLLCASFAKWKGAYLLHAENLDLVNSFQDVKREDTLRRIFNKWLTSARKAKARRIRLAEHEQDLRHEMLFAAWEVWRDRFRENCLRELEYQVLLQSQRTVLYQTFILWYKKTKSIPAIRLYAGNLKLKTWKKWCDALPIAIRARKAREIYRKKLMVVAFMTWKEMCKSKIALKAIARARQLRLPSPGYKTSSTTIYPKDQLSSRPRLHRPPNTQTLSIERDNTLPQESAIADPAPRRRRLSNILVSRPILSHGNPTAGTAPSGRDSVADDGHSNNLWSELRRIHRSGSSLG